MRRAYKPTKFLLWASSLPPSKFCQAKNPIVVLPIQRFSAQGLRFAQRNHEHHPEHLEHGHRRRSHRLVHRQHLGPVPPRHSVQLWQHQRNASLHRRNLHVWISCAPRRTDPVPHRRNLACLGGIERRALESAKLPCWKSKLRCENGTSNMC
ncbi:unnamed protein product [Zymoseptoria tritici ST99CH_1E4]|uniref:Uncharacterized protein n=1 Tax=Zymoseptoria tritici ST99CH_1E4 TaxID=1276532 RepID=A0A2H1FWK6_ZYMTR|nr:unnamed protein product [Zymoseptoria tritici ST99CH_1E4]